MPDDIQTVLEITRIFGLITGICVTTFPVLYFFSAPWFKTHLGRALMLQSASIAFTIDLSIVAQYITITEDIHKILIINVVVLTWVSVGSLYLTAMLFHYNFRKELEYGPDSEALPQ